MFHYFLNRYISEPNLSMTSLHSVYIHYLYEVN